VSKTIVLDVTHPSQSTGQIGGFRFLWGYYVEGYRSDKHCQQCFYGKLVPDLSPTSESVGTPIALDMMERYSYVYICGVSAGPIAERSRRNLHLPMQFAEGALVTMQTYNGYVFRARNAALVSGTRLADDWNGLAREHARCRNFQFAVGAFGYPSLPRRAGSGAARTLPGVEVP
jgi:hypothetical protein